MIKSIITEYGVSWAFFRALYSAKLKALRALPCVERLYEPTQKRTDVKRIDIFEIDINAISAFLHELPEEQRNELSAAADDACVGRILGFSSILLDYGEPIDWQLNPLTGKTCDTDLKWYRISDFDKERGDIKVVWEASRFSHFLTLTRSFLLCGDKKYYDAFSCQLDAWLKANPYSYGANYKCGQECAIRMVNALLAYTVFEEAGVATVDDEVNVKELIGRCYRKILSNFFYAYRCIRNNHTLSELMGMMVGAWCCQDENTLRKAYRLLDKVIQKQFSGDGGYIQHSFNYQRLAMQVIECVIGISEATGRQISSQVCDIVKKSSELMYQCQASNGDVPNYGPNDGALIFPVTSCDYRDFRSVVNTTHSLTDGTRLFTSGAYDEELLWFAGGIEKYPIVDIERVSSVYPQAGLFCLRHRNSHMMIVCNDFKSRPAHMDQMHIDLWIDDVNVLCDSGTFSYADEVGAALASTSGHNTVKVLAREQMNKRGAFMICDWTKREYMDWNPERFEATTVSANGYKHRRRVEVIKDGYRITDEADTQSDIPLDILFHTPCDVVESADSLILWHNGKPICTISAAENSREVTDAVRSLYYLKAEGIHCIRIRRNCANGACKAITDICFC